MSKQSKKATKRKKTEKLKRKKKQLKKLGLSKYIAKENKNKKPKTVRSQPNQNEEDQRKQREKEKAKLEAIRKIKKQQRSLSLEERCKLQMSSSLLRMVDEKLYSSDTGSINLSKDEFLAYHDAYGRVCDSWPVKPIDYIVRFIKKRLFTKRPPEKWRIADVGCGNEPLLRRKLPRRTKIKSFDLISAHKDVIEANMDNLPLENESMNCVVYSLSLMAKNLGNILLEAKRVLKLNGSLLIVEVTSRFEGRVRRFAEKLERIGFKKQSISELKPNGYFIFFHFSKLDNNFNYSRSLVNIELKPCVYRTR